MKRSVRGIAYRVFEVDDLPAVDNTQFCANHSPAEWAGDGPKEERKSANYGERKLSECVFKFLLNVQIWNVYEYIY